MRLPVRRAYQRSRVNSRLTSVSATNIIMSAMGKSDMSASRLKLDALARTAATPFLNE